MVWFVFSTVALAATKGAKVASPAIQDQIVNVFADFINWVAIYVHDYGIALIIVTFIIRLLTMPLMLKSFRNTKKMQALKPQLDALKKKHGGDARKYQEEMMLLYKKEGVNPVAGCVPMLVQMVVLTVLYRAIYTDHVMLHAKFLGLVPLGVMDHTYILPVLAAITSFFQQKVSMVQTDPSQKMLMYIFPVMIFFFAIRVYAALALYWVFSNLFTMAQVYFTRVKPVTPMDPGAK